MKERVWDNEDRNKKISEKLTGRKLSEQHKENLRKPKSDTEKMKIPKSKRHIQRIIESRRKNGWFKNLEGTKKRMSQKHKKITNSGRYKKGHKETEEQRDKRIKKSIKGLKIKPNKPEKIMINIIRENNFPFNFVGDGQVIIGGFNPDFLSRNPKHIIEFFGDYWHNLPRYKDLDKRRLETYKKYGYKVLVVWEHELKNPFQVVKKIKEFIK